jgi:RNA polymerase sigma-70 factor (ECF subfamily)
VQRDLVEAARRGDLEAFEVLASAAGDRLYTIARLILRDTHQAEDAVQEALLRAWREASAAARPGAMGRVAVPTHRQCVRR